MHAKQYSLLFFALGLLVYWLVPKNILTVSDQAFGTTLWVDRVALARDGYVVVTRTPVGDEYTDFVGVSDFLPAGTYSGLSIELDLDTVMSTDSARELSVSLAFDTGDKEFSQLDLPEPRMFGGIHQRQINFVSK